MRTSSTGWWWSFSDAGNKQGCRCGRLVRRCGGGLGLAWAVLWLLLYRHLDRHPALSREEADYIGATQESGLRAAKHSGPRVFDILKQRDFWGIALPRFCADPVWGTLVYWMPLYLYQARGFDLKAIALTAWLPFVAADLGCMVGGPLSAWLKRRFDVPIVNGKRIACTMAARS
ncbi:MULTISPECIES: MFS transporter [Paraburkholderia]|uniref:MFS transporter n=1 Tax=Paraburkholderia TaxID=1822464 RepID=UPI001EF9AC7F|nr:MULTISPECIES: MFS transporter [Paraburkholderia]MDH6151971.1 hypothetical protein [Paraburkholderia sp. WSM4179]